MFSPDSLRYGPEIPLSDLPAHSFFFLSEGLYVKSSTCNGERVRCNPVGAGAYGLVIQEKAELWMERREMVNVAQIKG